jgi:hypothetical protein
MPRMVRELRKAARDTGADVSAHHGLVKIIPQWERGDRALRERYRLLYLKVFTDMVGGCSPARQSARVPVGTDACLIVLAARVTAPDRCDLYATDVEVSAGTGDGG